MIPVTLSLRFQSRIDGESDDTSMELPGTLKPEIGGFALRYTEVIDNAQTEVLIRTDGRRAVITRTGPASVTFTCEPGVSHPSLYETSVGSIPMTVKDASVDARLSEDGGTVHLRYTLEMGGGDSFHEITIACRKG